MLRNLQFHFGLVARLDRGDLRQLDRLPQEIGDRFLGVGEAVFHEAILADRRRRLAQPVMDLAEDVDRLPLVRAFDLAAAGLVDVFPLGHLAAHVQRRLVLALGELAVADDVAIAVDKVAFSIPLGVPPASCRRLAVGLQVQERAGRAECRLVGRRIVGPLCEEAFQHRPPAVQEIDLVDLRLPQLGVVGRFGGLGVDIARRGCRPPRRCNPPADSSARGRSSSPRYAAARLAIRGSRRLRSRGRNCSPPWRGRRDSSARTRPSRGRRRRP